MTAPKRHEAAYELELITRALQHVADVLTLQTRAFRLQTYALAALSASILLLAVIVAVKV